uniref:Uncharacterized protein n=1 Tax=Bos indicus x Bos taurus TaxID=30522 RepID=A0A4W2FXJ3_BOBOX
MAATWTLVLVVMGLGLARARAVPTTTRKGCNTGMFKSLLPGELEAFKKEKDRNSLEDSLLQKDWDCISHLFPRTRDLKHLQVNWESQAHLVLGAVITSSLDHTLGQPLLMTPQPLPVSHTTLFCARVWAQPTAGCRPQGLFQHWLPQLQEAPEKTSRPAPFNLFHLLTWDVNCVTRRDMCI